MPVVITVVSEKCALLEPSNWSERQRWRNTLGKNILIMQYVARVIPSPEIVVSRYDRVVDIFKDVRDTTTGTKCSRHVFFCTFL